MKIAVYGTLRKGQGNHKHFLHNAEFLGAYRLGGFVMGGGGCGFPYAAPSKNAKDEITIEVFEVCPRTFERLDRLEGYPTHYQRMIVEVDGNPCWIYYIEELPAHTKRIMSGDWIEDLSNRE